MGLAFAEEILPQRASLTRVVRWQTLAQRPGNVVTHDSELCIGRQLIRSDS